MAEKASRSTLNGAPSGSGRWGKSSAPCACSVYSLWPQATRTAPVPIGCSIVTSWAGSAFTMSSSRRPGSTTAPGSSTRAATGTRNDSSMSVAASSSEASARSKMPERIWTVDRCDTPRAAIAKPAARSAC